MTDDATRTEPHATQVPDQAAAEGLHEGHAAGTSTTAAPRAARVHAGVDPGLPGHTPRPAPPPERRPAVAGDRAAEADVLLDVPNLKVDEINLEVADLRARVSLNAEVLDLLRLHVGADVALGKVELGIKGVEAQALLKVRLDNVAAIIRDVLRTIDNNPQLLENITAGVGRAVGDVGTAAGHAVADLGTSTGRAVEGLGTSTGHAVEGLGTSAGQAVAGLGATTGQAVQRLVPESGPSGEPGGVTNLLEGVGRTAGAAGGGLAENAPSAIRSVTRDTTAAPPPVGAARAGRPGTATEPTRPASPPTAAKAAQPEPASAASGAPASGPLGAPDESRQVVPGADAAARQADTAGNDDGGGTGGASAPTAPRDPEESRGVRGPESAASGAPASESPGAPDESGQVVPGADAATAANDDRGGTAGGSAPQRDSGESHDVRDPEPAARNATADSAEACPRTPAPGPENAEAEPGKAEDGPQGSAAEPGHTNGTADDRTPSPTPALVPALRDLGRAARHAGLRKLRSMVH